MPLSFPFADYWWFYAAFSALVLLLLAVDLGVFHRRAHVVSFRESVIWSIAWVTMAVAVCVGLGLYAGGRFGADTGRQIALEFLAGYLVEKSLAVDNIFVFVVVFTYFAVPPIYQHRVLFYGILGALLFRVIFIALGSVLLKYTAVVIFFGLFLIATGVKIIFAPEKPIASHSTSGKERLHAG